jgi:hypothetical protein
VLPVSKSKLEKYNPCGVGLEAAPTLLIIDLVPMVPGFGNPSFFYFLYTAATVGFFLV